MARLHFKGNMEKFDSQFGNTHLFARFNTTHQSKVRLNVMI